MLNCEVEAIRLLALLGAGTGVYYLHGAIDGVRGLQSDAMNELFRQILRLVEGGEVKISDHGYDEMAADGLYVRDVIGSVLDAVVIEEYPDYAKGPCVLVLQKDRRGEPIHVVWGIPKGKSEPAVLVTAYKPDPQRWEPGFTRRKK